MWAFVIVAVVIVAASGAARADAQSALPLAGQQSVPAKSAPTATVVKVKGLLDGVAIDRSPARVLGGLRTSFDAKAGRHLGVHDQTDALNTEVGAPLRMLFIDAGSLRAYGGGPPDALLREVPLVTRLVRVQGQARSLLVQSNASGDWQTVRMGDALRAAAIDQIGNALISQQGVAASDLFLVRIPALGLDFVGYQTGSLRLVPLFDSPQWGLQAGQSADGAAVLASLVGPAQTFRTTGRGR